MSIATQLERNDGHRRDHHDIDHDVLDEGDHRGCAQAARIGVNGQDHEGDDQRQFALQTGTADAQAPDHDLHADQLEGDIGHGGEDAGEGNRQSQPLIAVAAFDEVGAGDVVVLMRNRPQARHDGEHDRIDDDRIRQREEAVSTLREHDRRHGDHGIGGVEVAADQEPGDDGAETPPAQAPFMQLGQIAGFPARGDEAQHGDQGEEKDEDDQGRPIDGIRAHLTLR